MRHSAFLTLGIFVFIAAAQEATQPQFTARELFYAASDPAPAAKQAAKPAPAPAPKTTVAATRPAVTAPQVRTAAVTAPTSPVAQPVAVPAPHPVSPAPQPSSSGTSSMVVKAAYTPTTAPAPTSGTPLGLKYTILKKVGDDMVEVPPDTIFHADDRLQVSVQTNGPGYLYIVVKGSSGTWMPMFPSPEVADGNNHVDGWNSRVLPTGSRMKMDTQTGTEHLFVIFSRTPEDSLENMIYSLQGTPKAQPAADKAGDRAMDKPAKKFLVTASVEIPDGAVNQLRDTYTRDLIIEKVDEKTQDKSSATKENATYVVNPSGSSNSRVVAEINLEHR